MDVKISFEKQVIDEETGEPSKVKVEKTIPMDGSCQDCINALESLVNGDIAEMTEVIVFDPTFIKGELTEFHVSKERKANLAEDYKDYAKD